MKRNNTMKAISLFMACLMVGCASYTPTMVRLDPSGPNVAKVTEGDFTLYIEEYVTQEKAERAFDTDLAKEGVLPLLILLENNGEIPCEVVDIVVRGDTPLKELTPEEAADKASRSAVGRAIGWSLLVPIIAIPIAAAASAGHTSKVNKQMVADFTAKAFLDEVIMPNKDFSGFVYFELEEGRQDLSGLSLEMTAKNIVTQELTTVIAALPGATFTQKKEKKEKPKEDADLMNPYR